MIPYATFHQIKAELPDMGTAVTDWDAQMRRLAERASRMIDRLTGRTFWPSYETRYFEGNGEADLWIPDLMEVGSIAMSDDSGVTYTALAATDYYTLGGDRLEYSATPIRILRMNQNSDGDYTYWYTGQRSVRVVGWWGWHDDYGNAWRDSQDTVEDNPLTAVATTVTVNDADGADLWGETPRFQVGQLVKAGSEQMLVRVVTAAATNTLAVSRGQNGTTAAEHAQNVALYVWQPPEVVRQAVIIQAARWFKRGQQAYQDTGAAAELGQMTYTQKLDPEIQAMLYDAGLRRVTV